MTEELQSQQLLQVQVIIKVLNVKEFMTELKQVPDNFFEQ
jgi:hypothetical protein